MPEMRFEARWPDGSVETYYSPSLVIRDYLVAGATYALEDFVERSRTALRVASQRVYERYGFHCPRAAATLAAIETKAREVKAEPDARVRIEVHHTTSAGDA